jgi:hypothetical protein
MFTTMRETSILCVLYLATMTPACDGKPKAQPEPAATAAPSAIPKPPEKPTKPAFNPKDYGTSRSRDGFSLSTVDDDCKPAYATMATSKLTKWSWARYAVAAHPEFKEVSNPSEPGEVTFYQHDEGFYTLRAKCADGKTCNALAAMYLNVVWAARPRVSCGEMPSKPKMRRKQLTNGDGTVGLPTGSDYRDKCARLNGCAVAADSDKWNVGPDCQKGPSRFKLKCALHETCKDVVACMAGSISPP